MSDYYQVRYEKAAQKSLKKMDRFQAALILAWIEKNLINSQNPRQFGKGLTADRSGEWRYRVGDYRIIADIDDSIITILIVEIGHSREIYRQN